VWKDEAKLGEKYVIGNEGYQKGGESILYLEGSQVASSCLSDKDRMNLKTL
jgi:hypothetical protein